MNQNTKDFFEEKKFHRQNVDQFFQVKFIEINEETGFASIQQQLA